MAPTTENEIKASEKKTGASMRRFLRLNEVKQVTGLGHATIYAWMASGDFPKPVPLGGRRVGWIDAEIAECKTSALQSATRRLPPSKNPPAATDGLFRLLAVRWLRRGKL